MIRPFARRLAGPFALLVLATAAQAQFFGGGCASCGQAASPIMPRPFASTFDSCGMCAPPVAYNPCTICQPVAVMQPVQQTVYREMPVTKYRPVTKTVQRPVIKTVYEERPVTAYRQVMDTRTVEVPGVQYQTVTECQQRCVDRSHWQTVYQRVPKATPCQYDPNPTMLGWMNRGIYRGRSAMTPNYMRSRQYVPNVMAYSVPVNRTVAVPTTRQVTYNVARMEAYQTTQTVAVLKTEMVDTQVTAYEPYTEMQTVAVGTTTTYAYAPIGGTTATAGLEPTPATAAGDTPIRSRTATNAPASGTGSAPSNPPATTTSEDLFTPLSHPRRQRDAESEPQPTPSYFDARSQSPEAAFEAGETVASAAGWRARRTPIESTTPAIHAPVHNGEAAGDYSVARISH
jgi:hypothetical protein